MNGTYILIGGLATGLNLIIIKVKLDRKRYSDAILDGGILALVGIVFKSTISGLMIGVVASSIVSLYLFFSPPPQFLERFIDENKDNFK